MAKTKYQNMSYNDIRPISQFSNVNPTTNVLWGVKDNQYSGNLNLTGTDWKWLCNAIDIYWGKPSIDVTGDNITSVSNPTIATTTDLLKFIETTAQAVNNKVNKVEIPQNLGESVNLPNGGYIFTWNGSVTEYRDMYWDGESESKMIVFVARHHPLESGNSKLGKIWKAIVCDYDDNSNIISYDNTYTDPDIPDNILALFNEKEATTTRSGLMSTSDKKKLDNIIVDINNYRTENTTLPLGDGYIYYDSSLSYGKYINLERISLAYDDEDGHIEGSRGSDNGPFYIFRNNVGQDDESFDVWDSNGRYHGCWDEYGYDGPEADYTEAYRRDENPIDVIGYIKEILCENLASEDKDGLMSAEDKQKLDGAATLIDLKNYKDKDISVLPLNGCYVNSGQPVHSIKLWYNDDNVQCLAFCIYHDDDDDDLDGSSSNHEIMYYTKPNGEDNYVCRGTFTTNNPTNDLEKEIANAFCCESDIYFIDANKGASFWPVSSYNNYITQHEIDQDKIHIYWQDEKYILWIIDPVEMPEADTLYCILKTNNIYRCVKVKTYATESDSGLMSSSDKQKLDNLPTVFNYSQYCIPNGKIPFNIDFSNYILPCNVEMRMWRNNEYWYLCFAYNELGDIDETNTDWRLRYNYYLFMLHDVSGGDNDRNNYTFVNVYTNTTVLVDQTALDAKVAEAFGYSNNNSNS